MSENTETAILAGACFWSAQELLRHRAGVISTRVGYTGGENNNPTVGNHPGHAEAVKVMFDPGRTSYRDILEFFFQIHRPDLGEELVGPDYRSEIFYTSDEQRRIAADAIADASGFWGAKVVTKISQAGPFWEAEAEAEDQDYLQRYTDGNNQFSPYRSAARHSGGRPGGHMNTGRSAAPSGRPDRGRERLRSSPRGLRFVSADVPSRL